MRHAPASATLLALGFLAAGAAAQGAPPITWSRTYGGPVSLQGLHDIRQLHDGRLVAAGYTASFGGPSTFNWLLNLDLADGEVRLQEASSSTFGGFCDGARVASDGGALFLGRDVLDLFIKHDAWLVRTDAKGDIQWTQGFTRPGSGRHVLFDAAELPDGSWIAVGATSLFDFPPQPAWIVRLDASGALLWQYEYGGGVAETARAVTPTADGGFAVAGWTNSAGAGSDDAWVLKLDAAGAIQWQKTFGGADADQAEALVQLPDGSFAVAGSTNSLTLSGHAPWLLRLDARGALLWHRVVDDGVWGDLGAVARTGDGQIVVVGRVGEPGFPTNDLWCAKFSAADGKLQWQRAYEGQLGDFGSAVLPLAGSGYVVGGTWGWGFPGESLWLQRTDRAGGLPGCGLVRTTAFAPTSPSITGLDGPTVRVPGGAETQALGVQTAPSAAVIDVLCR